MCRCTLACTCREAFRLPTLLTHRVCISWWPLLCVIIIAHLYARGASADLNPLELGTNISFEALKDFRQGLSPLWGQVVDGEGVAAIVTARSVWSFEVHRNHPTPRDRSSPSLLHLVGRLVDNGDPSISLDSLQHRSPSLLVLTCDLGSGISVGAVFLPNGRGFSISSRRNDTGLPLPPPDDYDIDIPAKIILGRPRSDQLAVWLEPLTQASLESYRTLTTHVSIPAAEAWLEERASAYATEAARIRNSRSSHGSLPHTEEQQMESSQQKTIELMVINDHLRHQQEKSETTVLTAGIANMADALFSRALESGTADKTSSSGGLQLRLMLVGQITFTRDDPYSVSGSDDGVVSATDLLGEFQEWFSSIAPSANIPRSDSHFLLSGYTFEGNTVGVAPVGVMCRPKQRSGGVVQTAHMSVAQSGLILAHELAHNLGVLHDTDPCETTGHIMSSVQEGGRLPNSWSDCSKDFIRSFLQSSRAECLSDLPDKVWSPDTCGDGVVDSPQEQCDCGQRNCSGVDDCCDGRACLLRSDSGCPLPAPIPTKSDPGIWGDIWDSSSLWTIGALAVLSLILIWVVCYCCVRKVCSCCHTGVGARQRAAAERRSQANGQDYYLPRPWQDQEGNRNPASPPRSIYPGSV